jgi:hypothetical protein
VNPAHHIPTAMSASLGAVLTLAAFSAADTQAKPDFPAITVDSLDPLLQEDNQSGIIYRAQPKRRRKGRKSMNRRSGQNGTIVVQSGWYRVRWRMDVEGQEQRINMSEKVAPAVFDKNGIPNRLRKNRVERAISVLVASFC